jgi:hypothetical protein
MSDVPTTAPTPPPGYGDASGISDEVHVTLTRPNPGTEQLDKGNDT